MANLSEAKGVFSATLKNTSADDFSEFMNKFKTWSEEGEYGMWFDVPGQSQIIRNGNEVSCLAIPFEGAGRWTFENNLKLMGKWMSADKNASFFSRFDFRFSFDFYDLEPGEKVFYGAYETVTHKAGDPLGRCIFGEYFRTDGPFNAESAVLTGFASPDAVIDQYAADKTLLEFLTENDPQQAEAYKKLYRKPEKWKAFRSDLLEMGFFIADAGMDINPEYYLGGDVQ